MKPKDSVAIGSKVKLRPKRLADARNDYAWLRDPQLAELDAAPLLTISFPQHLLDYAIGLHYPSQTSRRLGVETTEGKHIGNCSCYNIEWDKGEAELGIMIGDRDYWNRGYGTDAVATLVSYIFCQTSLKRIHLKTLTTNIRAQRCFMKCGFTPYGRLLRDGYKFILMELPRNQWEKQQTKEEKGETPQT